MVRIQAGSALFSTVHPGLSAAIDYVNIVDSQKLMKGRGREEGKILD